MLWCTKLRETFPNLFKNIYYIECSSGWEKLIEQMCLDIIRYESFLFKDNYDYKPVTFLQVKEKFGSLRVYSDGGYLKSAPIQKTQFLRNVISDYETISEKVCCGCGIIVEKKVNTSHVAPRFGAMRCKECMHE